MEKMREAAARVKAKEINLRQAVEIYGKYGVKQTTLYDIVKGKSSPSRHSGHKAKVSTSGSSGEDDMTSESEEEEEYEPLRIHDVKMGKMARPQRLVHPLPGGVEGLSG